MFALTYWALLTGASLSFLARIVVGRLAGLITTVACGAAIAYFFMAPIFSFRISQPIDAIALSLYGAVGLVLFETNRGRTEICPTGISPSLFSRARPHTNIGSIISELARTDLGDRLRKLKIPVEFDSRISLPCTHTEAIQILSDLLAACLDCPEVQRVWIHHSRQPGMERLSLIAHRTWPFPAYETIHIGKRDEDCEALEFANWPFYSRVTVFDNGYARIYQLTLGSPVSES
jgi:hypothetical protein